MIAVIFIVVILLLLLLYLLVAPFYIEINSDSGLFRIRFYLLANARIRIHDRTLLLSWSIAGWHRDIDLLVARSVTPKKTDIKQEKKVNGKGLPLRKAWAMLKTFKVTKCDISVDTGSMPINGILYPQFYLAGRLTKRNICINFNNQNRIILEIKNSISRLAWAYLKSTFIHHK